MEFRYLEPLWKKQIGSNHRRGGGWGLGLQRLTGKKKLGLVRIIENSEKPAVQEIGIILDKIFP